jgi:YHS domain-containing protein
MFRGILYVLIVVLLLGVLRSIVGVLMKGLGELFSSSNPGPSAKQPASGPVQLGGELKKDPVCGTYISTATSIKKKFGNETLHFCSQECADKYRIAS